MKPSDLARPARHASLLVIPTLERATKGHKVEIVICDEHIQIQDEGVTVGVINWTPAGSPS